MIQALANTQSWLERNWHPLCGIIYLVICFSDFVAMPVFYEWSNYQLTAEKTVELAIKFADSGSQIQALTILRQERAWVPITLAQNGLFHLAFGAILGVGAWTRGRQQGTDALNDLSSQIQTMVSSPNAPPGYPNNYGGQNGGYPNGQPFQPNQPPYSPPGQPNGPYQPPNQPNAPYQPPNPVTPS
jgi:hypothetical protein